VCGATACATTGQTHTAAQHNELLLIWKPVRLQGVGAVSSLVDRVRLTGLNENRTTGNWVVAAYTHDTSRELDPQLHNHAVVAFNLRYDGTEGRWKALQASGLYERRSYLTEVYRNALAREVCALGLDSAETLSTGRRVCAAGSAERGRLDNGNEEIILTRIRPSPAILTQRLVLKG
jgi:TrwC relaxase